MTARRGLDRRDQWDTGHYNRRTVGWAMPWRAGLRRTVQPGQKKPHPVVVC
jgi:hypothetical protein